MDVWDRLLNRKVAKDAKADRKELARPGLEVIGADIVDSAIKVHRVLGPGLLESAYQRCLTHELRSRGFEVTCEVLIPITYDTVRLGFGYRVDMIVNDSVVIENKTVERVLPIHSAQILTYLRLSGLRLGFLLNWYVPLMKDGNRRFVNNL